MSNNDKQNGYPYKVIDEFFSYASLSQHRKYISTMLEAAYSEDYWRKSEPAALLYFHEQMEKLMSATHVILTRRDKTVRSKIVLADKESVNRTIDPATYFGKHRGDDIWAFFPRSLSRKEFIDPYLAVEKFFIFKSLGEWRKSFKKLIFYALSTYGAESALEFDFLKTYHLLQKLVEAAHLIQVRLNK